ncbi:MAG TPA: integrase arm-type DNA-binding domain-containing protein [Xanthobacteraceae bacterium]|nr:integrase arm-type DNA-binding domain-containing protein [Xanthobacteraceae bacterium]
MKHAKVGMHADGGGLYLQVTAGKEKGQLNKSWLFRYKLARRERQMGLGSFNTIGLKDAREEAERWRKVLKEGKDPIEVRDAERAGQQTAKAKSVTFKWCATAYVAAHEAGWRNAKHRQQWHNTLSTYAYPIIGNLPVDAIDTGMVMQILQPLWTEKNETASRIRGRIEKILDWATVNGHRSDGKNPAQWQGHLEHLLAARSKVHKVVNHPALPWEQIPEFMQELRRVEGLAAKCLEYTILTAARSGESRGTPWEGEINTKDRVWIVQASRMKREREHRIPLTAPALAIIEYMREVRQNDYVFPGDKGAEPLSDMALTEVIRRVNQARKKAGLPLWVDPKQENREVVPHGFRSSFRDWVDEATAYADWLAEAALAHAKGDKVEAAYKRGDALAKRRKLMEEWADYCGGEVLLQAAAE